MLINRSTWIALIILVSVCSSVQSNEKRRSVDEVIQAWKTREKEVRSARFVLEEVSTMPKGSRGKMPGQHGTDAPLMPLEDVTFRVKHTIVFENNQIRYLRQGQSWRDRSMSLQDESYIAVFAGNLGSTLYEKGGAADHPFGKKQAETAFSDSSLIPIYPLILCYRATSGQFELPFVIKQLQDTGLTNQVNNRPCQQLRITSPVPRKNVESIWIDLASSLTARHMMSVDGAVMYQMDIYYRPDPKVDWVPEKWTLIYNNSDGGLQQSWVVTVTQYEINCEVEPKEFELTFPPGALVRDETKSPPLVYIVKDDDTLHKLTDADRSKSYTELMQDATSQQSRWIVLTLILTSAILLALVAWALNRRRVRSKS